MSPESFPSDVCPECGESNCPDALFATVRKALPPDDGIRAVTNRLALDALRGIQEQFREALAFQCSCNESRERAEAAERRADAAVAERQRWQAEAQRLEDALADLDEVLFVEGEL